MSGKGGTSLLFGSLSGVGALFSRDERAGTGGGRERSHTVDPTTVFHHVTSATNLASKAKVAATRPRVRRVLHVIPGVVDPVCAAPRFRVHAYSAGLPTVYKSGRGETTGFRILATLDPRIGWWTRRRLRQERDREKRARGTVLPPPSFLPPAPLVFFEESKFS